MRKAWPTRTLGEVCQFRGGGTPSKEVDQYWHGDIPWVSPKDMKFEIVSDSIDHISPEAIESSATSLIPKNSVLMVVRSGILARTVPIAITGRDVTINQDLKALCPNDAVDPRFLYYLLDSKMDLLLSMVSRGATVHRLMTDQVRSLGFACPPLSEQQRIIGILDETVEGITIAKANAEKNLQNARALFESHLQSVSTQRSEGLVERRLDEVARDFGRGKSKHRPRNDPRLYGGSYPFIQTGDIRNSSHLIESYHQTYNEVGLAQSKLWPSGTVCITIAANIAETGILAFDACFPDSVIGVVVDERHTSNRFLEYLLQSFKVRLQAQGNGSAQANINMGTFEDQVFPFPSLNEQNRIVETLDTLREDTQRLESIYQQKIASLEALKKSLLYQAFTGNL